LNSELEIRGDEWKREKTTVKVIVEMEKSIVLVMENMQIHGSSDWKRRHIMVRVAEDGDNHG
jgi:hypothetical protein